jgi:hypothetical protein
MLCIPTTRAASCFIWFEVPVAQMMHSSERRMVSVLVPPGDLIFDMLIRIDLADTQNFGPRGSEVQILSPRPTSSRSITCKAAKTGMNTWPSARESDFVKSRSHPIKELHT